MTTKHAQKALKWKKSSEQLTVSIREQCERSALSSVIHPDASHAGHFGRVIRIVISVVRRDSRRDHCGQNVRTHIGQTFPNVPKAWNSLILPFQGKFERKIACFIFLSTWSVTQCCTPTCSRLSPFGKRTWFVGCQVHILSFRTTHPRGHNDIKQNIRTLKTHNWSNM